MRGWWTLCMDACVSISSSMFEKWVRRRPSDNVTALHKISSFVVGSSLLYDDVINVFSSFLLKAVVVIHDVIYECVCIVHLEIFSSEVKLLVWEVYEPLRRRSAKKSCSGHDLSFVRR
ncbi:hypothetical protein AB6A40_010539 [Gnathostoma spinigerum]|uniref:Uncharacterized protein n=1 Tax=Gnathostoma spinigerum TaxID=75299 RepID=A0ABD6EWG0_9BILA